MERKKRKWIKKCEGRKKKTIKLIERGVRELNERNEEKEKAEKLIKQEMRIEQRSKYEKK